MPALGIEPALAGAAAGAGGAARFTRRGGLLDQRHQARDRIAPVLVLAAEAVRGDDQHALTSKRSCTAVATLLTFWPPGPEARMKESSISFSSSAMPGATLIMGRKCTAPPHCPQPGFGKLSPSIRSRGGGG
jgi:hypothetical protein